MDSYFVSKRMNAEGFHIIHKQSCPDMPELKDALYLCYFSNSAPAIQKVKNYFELVAGCAICSKRGELIN